MHNKKTEFGDSIVFDNKVNCFGRSFLLLDLLSRNVCKLYANKKRLYKCYLYKALIISVGVDGVEPPTLCL
jgi:hypothetical protein